MAEELNKYNGNHESNGRFGGGSGGDTAGGGSGGSSGGADNQGDSQGGGSGGGESQGGGGENAPAEEPVDVGEYEGMGRRGEITGDTMTPLEVANNDDPSGIGEDGESLAERVLSDDDTTYVATEGWTDQDFANLDAMANLDWASPEAVSIIETPSWEKSLNPSTLKNKPSMIVKVAEGKLASQTSKWTEKEWVEYEKVASESNKRRGDFVKMVSIQVAKASMADVPPVKDEIEELEKSGVSQMMMGSINNQTYLKAYKRETSDNFLA